MAAFKKLEIEMPKIPVSMFKEKKSRKSLSVAADSDHLGDLQALDVKSLEKGMINYAIFS